MDRTQYGAKAASLLPALAVLLAVAWSSAVEHQHQEPGNTAVGLELIAEGMDSPLALADPADDSGRLFVADQAGLIYIVDAEGNLLDEPFLDISDKLPPRREVGLEERGLLGFALHPDFADNGWFYVTYSTHLRDGAPPDWDHTRRVSEFKVSAGDPNRANHDSERVLIELDWPTHKHNGGGLAFGPDGYLYIGFGDGGGIHGIGDRPDYGDVDEIEDGERWWPVWHHWDLLGQDLTTLFGKILRIDIDRGFPEYAIPRDNPLVGSEGRDEIYAWGFRQPYRFSFDQGGGRGPFVANTGHFLVEAIFLVNRPGNYGWPLREGTRCYDPEERVEIDDCPTMGPHGERLIDPVIEVEHQRIDGFGTAAVGGFVYRGDALPELYGQVVFGDWGTGLHRASPTQRHGELWSIGPLVEVEGFVLSLGQDAAGELYVLTNEVIGLGDETGKVHKLVPENEAAVEPPEEPPVNDAADTDNEIGWFAAAQAESGRALYQEHCQVCHGARLTGEQPFPPLIGERFMRRWEGRTAYELFRLIHDTMPLGMGGTLTEKEYTNIFAFMLQQYGYPEGAEPLVAEKEEGVLEKLIIEPQ